MKREMMQFGIEVGAILLIGFAALALGGCTTPTEPQFYTETVFVPQLDINGDALYAYDIGQGQPIIVTADEARSRGYADISLRPLGVMVPKDSRLAQCRPGGGKINDTMRDTSER